MDRDRQTVSILLVLIEIVLWSPFGATFAAGQATQPKPAPGSQTAAKRAQTPVLAEVFFKNVQVLKGIPVSEFMDTMGFFAASLSLNCTSCHGLESASDVSKFADDTPLKQTARKMILMVRAINREHFAGQRLITCYTCHRGDERPKERPSLAEQYGAPPPDDPNDVEIPGQASGGPSADQIFDKYLAALGNPQQLAQLTSFVAKGTYSGYDTDKEKYPVEVFAQAPDKHAMMVHMPDGDKTVSYDGRAGWLAEPDTPVPLMELTGQDLDGAKLEAELFFPAKIKQARSKWQAGATTIDDRDVEVIQGTGASQTTIKLYFDKESGLLVRAVHFANTVVGQVTTQTDYSDYRDVSGVKIPFKWTETWVDGQSTTELSDVTTNARIDAAKFAKPMAAAKPPAR
jgi:photosynthetic reaction center cytochrome c subunit